MLKEQWSIDFQTHQNKSLVQLNALFGALLRVEKILLRNVWSTLLGPEGMNPLALVSKSNYLIKLI
jgi:hypothetical protein